jgi:ABC-type lipoprotein export system ATPase subunit
MSLLSVTRLTKSWEGEPVLDDLDLELSAGGHTHIRGASGAGKSTLLQILARLVPSDGGAVRFMGKPLEAWGRPSAYRQAHLGLVFQDLWLIESLSVRHNLQILGCPADRLDALLEPLGITDLEAPVHKLSRGERQRVCMARAFVGSPRLVLADEPTASLDPACRDAAFDHLMALASAGGSTLLVVSHDRDLAAHPGFVQHLHLEAGVLVEAL